MSRAIATRAAGPIRAPGIHNSRHGGHLQRKIPSVLHLRLCSQAGRDRGDRRTGLTRAQQSSQEAEAGSTSPTSAHALNRLRQVLQDSNSRLPYLLEEDVLSESVVYKSDLWECKGKATYGKSCKLALKRQRTTLSRVRYDLLKLSEIGPGELLVRWSISWVPPSMERFADLGESFPGLRVEYIDILDRLEQETSFTWEALGRFLLRIITTGNVRVPLAVMLGSSTIQIDRSPESSEFGQAQRIVEKWEMIPLVTSGRLRNRRAGRDLAALMDTVRPPDMTFEDWEGLVLSKVNMNDVPGMSPMDVDGLDDQAVENISTAISLLTLIVLVGGGAAAYVVYVRVLQQQGQLPDF